jgi:Creatinine amidohydrolase
LIIVNAHGGNAVLTNIVRQANSVGPLGIGLYPSREDWAEARAAAGMTSSSHDDMHAGELETSILLAYYPEYLLPGWHTGDHQHSDRRYPTTLGMHADTDTGVIGQPSLASADNGRAVLDHLAKAAHPSSPFSPAANTDHYAWRLLPLGAPVGRHGPDQPYPRLPAKTGPGTMPGSRAARTFSQAMTATTDRPVTEGHCQVEQSDQDSRRCVLVNPQVICDA